MDVTEVPETKPVPPKPKAKPGRKPTKPAKKMLVHHEEIEDGRSLRGNKVSAMAELDMDGAPLRRDGEDEIKYMERLLAWKREEVAAKKDAEYKALTGGKDHHGRVVTHPKQGPWNVARARKVYVNQVSHMGQRVRLQLGNLPTIEILRGRWVIIPYDAYTVLQDATTKHEFHDMSVFPPMRLSDDDGIEKTNYPFQDGGEVSWDEYLEFRDTEAKKPYSLITRKSLL